MCWLVVDDKVVAPLEIADTRSSRRRGLLGRSAIHGALLLSKTRSVHTVGMKFAIDVAHLDADLRVLRVTTMRPNRLGRWVWRAQHVLEAEATTLARLGISSGTQIAVRS